MDTHTQQQDAYEQSRWKAFGIVFIILSLMTVAGALLFQQLSKQTEPETYEECVKQNGSQSTTIFPGVCTTKSGTQFVQPLTEEEQDLLNPPVDKQITVPGWETYSNTEYDISVQYPPEWNRAETQEGTPDQTNIFSVYIYGQTQREGTEVYDGASFSIGTPVQTDQSAEDYSRDMHSSIEPAFETKPVFSQETINGITYEKVYTCGLGCFTYYYTRDGGLLYRFITFAEGPSKAMYETQLLQMQRSVRFTTGS